MHRVRVPFGAALVLLGTAAAHADFQDVTVSSGLYGDGPTWGAQGVDIDADGDPDLMLAHHFLGADLFTNDGSGQFSASGIPQIVTDTLDRHGMLWADLDGDGLLDVVISHGGGGGCGCPNSGNELWRSLGGGLLAPVDSAGGLYDGIGRGRAFSAADVDGDGDLDLHHAMAPLVSAPNRLYRNDGSLTFVDVAAAWGVDEGEGTVGALFADYDDDGDPDLLVGGEEFARGTILWRNDGGVFTDATAAAFGSLPVVAGADFGDYDNDGDVDLVICEGDDGIYDAWGVSGKDFWFFAHHRFSDDGVDAFQMESLGADPVAILEWQGAFQASRIFLGPSGVHPAGPVIVLTDAYAGAPTFTPGVDEGLYVWRESVGGPWQIRVSAPPGTAGNYSGLVFTSSGVANPSASNLEQLTIAPAPPRVFRNDGGTFAEVTTALGLTPSANPRGVAWVDFDNDGDLDLSLLNKGTAETRGEANVLWRNDGATFSALGGAGWTDGDASHLTDGGVWADFDGDGALDLLLQQGTGPAFFADLAEPLLYRNDGPVGSWFGLTLGVTLAGGTGVGTPVTCYAGGASVHRRVSANGWRGFQGPQALHFGLGAAATVDSLVIEWPGSTPQVVGPIAANQAVFLNEGDALSGVDAPAGTDAPAVTTVGFVTPQPSLDRQRLTIALAGPTSLRISVYDVAGRHVRTLFEGHRGRGPFTVEWDGRDATGRAVPSGLYFLHGRGDVTFSRKAIRLR